MVERMRLYEASEIFVLTTADPWEVSRAEIKVPPDSQLTDALSNRLKCH